MISDREVGAWWEQHVNERPVWRTEDLPETSFKQRLAAEGLALDVRRDVLCLCTPEKRRSPRDLILAHYWQIVSALLRPYAPFALHGPTALRCHLDDWSVPRHVYVATMRSRTRIELLDDSELVVDKELPLFDSPAAIEALTSPTGMNISVEVPESWLIRLRPRHMREDPELVMAFLKSAKLDLGRLKTLSQANYRQAKFKKLADWCAQVGRDEVAAILRAGRPAPRKLTPIAAPSSLVAPARHGQPVYVTRLLDHLKLLRDAVDEHLEQSLPSGLDLAEVLEIAERKKKLDTYHSSTIEGYRVSPEEIDLLMGRKELVPGGSPEEIERRMALRGYLDAHRLTLAEITRMFGKERALTERLLQDIHAELFGPTVDAGLLTNATLRRYRTMAVFIRSSRYVPPNHEKLHELMQRSVELINDTAGFAARAVLVHYAFVTIHPYADGNGRTARLLMNFILAISGAPWVTIRIEDRDVYFKALERAQCDSDFTPLIELFSRYFTQSDGLSAVAGSL